METIEIDYRRVLRNASVFGVIFAILCGLLLILFFIFLGVSGTSESASNLFLLLVMVFHFLFTIIVFAYSNAKTSLAEGVFTAGVFIGSSAILVPITFLVIVIFAFTLLSFFGRGVF